MLVDIGFLRGDCTGDQEHAYGHGRTVSAHLLLPQPQRLHIRRLHRTQKHSRHEGGRRNPRSRRYARLFLSTSSPAVLLLLRSTSPQPPTLRVHVSVCEREGGKYWVMRWEAPGL